VAAMRRSLVLIALAGCGSSRPGLSTSTMEPTPVATEAPAVPDQPPREEPKDLPCEPRMESWPAGHHDRYLFRDDKTELSGYTTEAGIVFISPRFREAYPFGPGGIAAVNEPNVGPGYIDTDGTMIAKAHPMDNGPDYFQDKLARIIGPDGKIGYLDDTGKIVIPPRFDAAMPFCNGKAVVELGGKQLTIDKTGAPIAP
jgi:hypothetical protein